MGNTNTITTKGDNNNVETGSVNFATLRSAPTTIKEHYESLTDEDQDLYKYVLQILEEKELNNADTVFIHSKNHRCIKLSLKSCTVSERRVHVGFNEKNEPAVVLEQVGVKKEPEKFIVDHFKRVVEKLKDSDYLA